MLVGVKRRFLADFGDNVLCPKPTMDRLPFPKAKLVVYAEPKAHFEWSSFGRQSEASIFGETLELFLLRPCSTSFDRVLVQKHELLRQYCKRKRYTDDLRISTDIPSPCSLWTDVFTESPAPKTANEYCLYAARVQADTGVPHYICTQYHISDSNSTVMHNRHPDSACLYLLFQRLCVPRRRFTLSSLLGLRGTL